MRIEDLVTGKSAMGHLVGNDRSQKPFIASYHNVCWYAAAQQQKTDAI